MRSGLLLSGGSDSLRTVIEFGVSILLARLLMPEDFGVVAVVGSILQISYVVANFGVGTAVVQVPDMTPADRDTAFTISAGVGLLMTLGIAALGPWASHFFAMPGLTTMIPVMSLQVLASGMSAIPVGVLRRALAFRQVVIVEMGATATYALVSITMALLGFGVWSLVWAPVVSSVYTLAAAFVSARYVPRFVLDSSSVQKLFGFSSGLTLKNVFVYAGRNADNFVVAKMLGDRAAGIYTRGFNLTRVPEMRVVGLVYRVCFPAFCKLQGDRERLHYWYVSTTSVVAISTVPLLLGFAAVADEFTIAVLGPHWVDLAPVLPVLCIGALVNCLHALGGAVIEAVGLVRYEVLTQFVYASAILFGCILGTHYGTLGVAYAVLIAAVILYCMKAVTVRAAIGLPIAKYVAASAPAVTAGAIMWLAVKLALHHVDAPWVPLALAGHWGRLLIGVIVGATTYPLALLLFGRSHVTLFLDQIAATTGIKLRGPVKAGPTTIEA